MWIENKENIQRRQKQLVTWQMIEDLLSLIEHNKPTQGSESGRGEKVILWSREMYETARQGFDLINNGQLKKEMLMGHTDRKPYHFANNFIEALDKDSGKAERFVRTLEKSLQGYQDAAACYDAPSLKFDSEQERKEVVEILERLRRGAEHGHYAFPSYSRFS